MEEKKEKKRFDPHNFMERTIFGILLFLVLGGLCYLGGWFFFGAVALICFIGLWEFYRLFGIDKTVSGVIGYLFAALYFTALAFQTEELFLPIILGAFIFEMGAYVFGFEKTEAKKAMASFFGFVYTVVFLSFLYRIRMLPDGLLLCVVVCVSAWGCDVFAYFTGILIGKHKMAPVLSPKKSVEGGIGGVVGAALLGALAGLLFKDQFTGFQTPVLTVALIAGVCSLISMIGDLTASAFKRNQGIKDYSHLIPGHGGILDRFDSIVLVAPIIFYAAVFFA